MLRSISRTPGLLRQQASILPRGAPLAVQVQQQRYESSGHAISNPTLANIEKRWEQMQPQEQAQLWMDLRDRMKTDWHQLTLHERKAAYWIAFGPHGPRAHAPPGENAKVFWYTLLGVGISVGIFATIRMFAGPPPKTMTKEWQEMSTEYLKGQNVEPITGFSAEGSEVTMVQSPPEKTQ